MDLVKHIMSNAVTTVSLSFGLDHLEKLMVKHNISCLPVIDNEGRCFGVISSADLIYWHSRDFEFENMSAWEVCTQQVIEVDPEMTVIKAADLMLSNDVHHLIAAFFKRVVASG